VSADPDGPPACETCGRPAAELVQDPDIFDTWFSSGLWPFSTLGWPDDTDDLRRYYPGTVMETGYDIIFFWVARMMMLGIHLTGEVPFRVVYLHGLVKDPVGAKMSKTRGNVVDPLEAIEEIGADALRFALIHGTTPGNDQKFSEQKTQSARNFANKLWNAARFVLGARPASVPDGAARVAPAAEHLGPGERWILSRAAGATQAADAALADFAFGELTRTLYDGIWSEFCDWGLELAKVRLADLSLSDEERAATWWTLVDALDTYLRLLHPVMPFVTEAIWGALPRAAGDPELLIVSDWPRPADRRDEALEASMAAVLETIVALRNARATAGVPAGDWLEAHVSVSGPASDVFAALAPAVERLARTRPLALHPDPAALPRREGALEVVLPSSGVEAVILPSVAAVERDRERLERELAEAERLLEAARARLGNEAFTARAPAAVVEGARAREAELATTVARLRERLGRAGGEAAAG
jgi:valyl-tRNA synthetase